MAISDKIKLSIACLLMVVIAYYIYRYIGFIDIDSHDRSICFIVREHPRQMLPDQSYLSWMSDFLSRAHPYPKLVRRMKKDLQSYQQCNANFSRADIGNPIMGNAIKIDRLIHTYMNDSVIPSPVVDVICTRAHQDKRVYCTFSKDQQDNVDDEGYALFYLHWHTNMSWITATLHTHVELYFMHCNITEFEAHKHELEHLITVNTNS